MTTEDMMWDDYDYYKNTGEPADWFEDENEDEYETDDEAGYEDESYIIEEIISQANDEKLNKKRYRKR